MKPVLTSIQGKDNSVLISEVAKLYFEIDAKIADVTYGKGVFWKWLTTNILNSPLEFMFSDINGDGTIIKKYDFRKLPYDSNYFDIVVFDPPYMHTGKGVKKSIDECYNNSISEIKNHKDVTQLYEDGMKEAYRILKPNGLLWVKCKDEIESGKQNWSHIEILNIGETLKFYAKDLFVFTQISTPAMRERYQLHARKNHSYLWIFQKR
jgi:DNA modification methylase